jgi:hypothetical protein
MAAHRYWRFNFHPHPPLTDFVAIIAEVELFTTVGGADISSQATVTTPNEKYPYVVTNVNDDNDSTYWSQWSDTYQWLRFDFGVGNNKDIVGYSFTANTISPASAPYAWDFQYSDDNSSWTTAISVSGETFGYGEKKTYSLSFPDSAYSLLDSPLGELTALSQETSKVYALLDSPLGALTVLAATIVYAPTIPTGVTYYQCKLTGDADALPDLVLPISSFQVRHRVDTESYYSVVIPGYTAIDAITARTHGQLVLWSNTDGTIEELMRGPLGEVSTARGATSQSITISGNASRVTTAPYIYTIDSIEYAYTTFSGDYRLRIPPRAGIRPGDRLQYAGSTYNVGEVTWSVSASSGAMNAQMEVSAS